MSTSLTTFLAISCLFTHLLSYSQDSFSFRKLLPVIYPHSSSLLSSVLQSRFSSACVVKIAFAKVWAKMKFFLLFCFATQTFGILNVKRPQPQPLREVYNVDSGFQTGGNYMRPARTPETLLVTQSPYFGNGEFQDGNNQPYFRTKKCPQCHCATKDTYICGSNQKIYRSQCAFTCAQMCDPGLFKRSMSHCV